MQPGNAPAKERFDSWKEIAAYLKRDERTVQRWEHERGLPVHRTPGEKRGTIFAYRGELDRWMRGDRLAAEASTSAPRASYRLQWTAGAAAVLMLLLLAAWLVRQRHRPAVATEAELVGKLLIGRNHRGGEVWAVPLPETVRPPMLAKVAFSGRPLWVVVANRPDGALVTCLREDGTVRWRYSPQQTLRFGSEEAAGPWLVYGVTTGRNGTSGIWMTVVHHLMGYSFVLRLDVESGKEEVKFVNTGTLWGLEVVPTAAGERVFVGGFNNEYDAGALAVLDPRRSQAVSPQSSGSRFECRSCRGATAPLKYFVFPRTELNRLEQIDINAAQMVQAVGDRVEVSTIEVSERARRIYFFTAADDPQLVSALSSSTYWREHSRLEREGRIYHRANECPERTSPPAVRLWEPEHGWRQVKVTPGDVDRPLQ